MQDKQIKLTFCQNLGLLCFKKSISIFEIEDHKADSCNICIHIVTKLFLFCVYNVYACTHTCAMGPVWTQGDNFGFSFTFTWALEI